MRIKKIYLNNFKGINKKKIISFDNQASLLIGPNGFGKTTIFDVLELCLTGEIHRTIEKAGVTNHRRDYIKPFFQNQEDKDVIVKVWLAKYIDNREKEFIITKHLPKDHDGRKAGDNGRRNKPFDFKFLNTYREIVENFYDDDFNAETAELINQGDIDEFFGLGTDGFEIKHIYNLFNYLQQEETTFFLKKSENERRSSLGFLFQTSNQEKEQQNISKIYSRLKDINTKLENKIKEIQNIEKLNIVEYEQLFPESDFDFDKKDIFENKDVAESERLMYLYNEELDKLFSFMNVFSPTEYKKKETIKLLNNKINNTDLVNFYTLQKLIEENYQSIDKQMKLLNDDEKIKSFILQKCYSKYEGYSKLTTTRNKYVKFLEIKDLKERIESLIPFVKEILPEMVDRYERLIEDRSQARATSKEIDLTINEIIRMRNSIHEEMKKDKTDILDEDTCPYCGKDWESHENLLENFNEREKTLKGLLNNQSNRLNEYEEEIENNFIQPIIKHMSNYLADHEEIDPKILELLKNYNNKEFNFTDLNSFDFNHTMIWSEPQSYDDLMDALSEIKENIQETIPVSKDVFEMMRLLNNVSFETDINELKKVISSDNLNQFILKDFSKKITKREQKEMNKKLISFLEESKDRFNYDYEKANDNEGIYKRYFKQDKDEFEKFNLTKIEKKKKYIKYLFSNKKSHLLETYKNKQDKLVNVLNKLDTVRRSYDSLIKKHKNEMVDNIKLPFYIYTAKMLQNYQQGMGVFLSTSDGKDAIRFLTDPTTDHDATHHLSSGQLAVVSLAFTLAINKTYNISDNLKFLTIDDPIQEMDALNVHSFIELIRHEFLKDYQFIFSTHSDMNALYMKYKFEKIDKKEVSLINVQNEFFD
ncbi:hypothetical protein CIL03_11285 [Virgibacillus indicus]|uniref:Endonuclease GajA/Old nuclease/RecF-like AAA domain-containing protein n=1 Tax=Virgibacillus indicus TaxID=2024554 RepID=A0A265N873_9BACI|nr:AAA family ATPase [Virgibacillus indicus]OZU88230.1 hypothetical protein CIL03_11285 [Virgibacillus indicus]